MKRAEEVWNVIQAHKGKHGAITAKEIGQIVGCDSRSVRIAIEYLRGEEGYPIASSSRMPAGYYVPNNPEEVRESIRHINSRIKHMRATVSSLENTLAEFETAV